ncbi:CPBP family intramembrane glutamic endopeptidase [Spirosoma montaniterrae]|uniref:CAAX prenyl protease 2/Lysostaphin resistance protein A-like domain-containing protein n=1 Tax=Spirosoma montaniterrae TaxID=1178516 RepID=A0A1P9WZ58_9BACT|nr:CPBP family intramembrane glutamic endopeptidase [Spirosoma montaniterrae]AQG80662.1 hypothetical protein AWR27_15810 [Spirosoma montaniterrae]
MKTMHLQTPRTTGLTLFLFGLLGVASLLTVQFPLTNLPKAVLKQFSPAELQWLILVNPLLLLVIAVIVGSLLYRKVGLSIFHSGDFRRATIGQNLLVKGIVPGVFAGLSIIGVVLVFQALIPDELAQLGTETKLTVAARFLYGGVTEEIMLRFGLMTLFVWLLSVILRTQHPAVYWIAIVGAALLFGAGHLTALNLMVAQPSPTLVVYIVLANALAGVVFGWVYWRHGLVFAMIAHAVAHVVMLLSEFINH